MKTLAAFLIMLSLTTMALCEEWLPWQCGKCRIEMTVRDTPDFVILVCPECGNEIPLGKEHENLIVQNR